MRGRSLGTFATLLLGLLAGCGGLEPRPAAPVPLGVRLADKKLALLEVTRGYDPTPEGKAHGSLRPELDMAAITKHLETELVLRNAAATLPPSKDDPLGRFPVDVAVVASGTTPEPGATVLKVSLESASVRYEGQTGIVPLKVAFVVMFFPLDFPNYFISSDRYTLVTRGRWKLQDTASGRTVAEGDAEGRETGVFGDLSRGWHFIGFVRSPGCLDPEDWERIADVLRPGAEEAFATAVAVAVEKSCAPPGADARAAARNLNRNE